MGLWSGLRAKACMVAGDFPKLFRLEKKAQGRDAYPEMITIAYLFLSIFERYKHTQKIPANTLVFWSKTCYDYSRYFADRRGASDGTTT
jgi:hypothetical protein